MTIEKTINGNTAELKLTGWLDTKTAPELEAALNSSRNRRTYIEGIYPNGMRMNFEYYQ